MPGKWKYNKINFGFTLMEVFIAISILSLGVVGSFGFLPKMILNQAMNTDAFLASQLAKEGMELVRNLRDSNWLSGLDWKVGLTSCSTGCEIDYNDTSLSPDLDRFLKLDNDNFYKYDSTAKDSKFKRKIFITEDSDFLNVKIEVSWNGKGSPFLLEENFYDWR